MLKVMVNTYGKQWQTLMLKVMVNTYGKQWQNLLQTLMAKFIANINGKHLC